MPKADPEKHPEVRSVGRLSGAWRVLRGDALVPDQIRVEWAEYQVIFSDLLSRLSASLARQAKNEKKRVAEELADPDQIPLALVRTNSDHKAELRRRAANLRGLPSPPTTSVQSNRPTSTEVMGTPGSEAEPRSAPITHQEHSP